MTYEEEFRMRGLQLLQAVVLACLLAAGLVGCGGGRLTPPPPAPVASPPTPAAEPPGGPAAAKAENHEETAPTAAEQALADVQAAAEEAVAEEAIAASGTCEEKNSAAPTGGQADKGCYSLKPGGGLKHQGRRSGRCEPQSLPYARCRSGIKSCNNGYENGPLTWFACEKKAGNTGAEAKAGTILILAANSKRKMTTGHVMYVEGVSPLSPSTCKLILSHTNYDRKCSKETKIEAIYNRKAMTIDIRSGAWKAWGQNLKVAGFILR